MWWCRVDHMRPSGENRKSRNMLETMGTPSESNQPYVIYSRACPQSTQRQKREKENPKDPGNIHRKLKERI